MYRGRLKKETINWQGNYRDATVIMDLRDGALNDSKIQKESHEYKLDIIVDKSHSILAEEEILIWTNKWMLIL